MKIRRLRIPGIVACVTLAAGACRCSPKPHGEVRSAMTDTPAETPVRSTAQEEPRPMEHDDAPSLDVDTSCPAALAETRRGGMQPNSYVAPKAEDLRRGRALMGRLLRGEKVDDLASLGFELVPLEGWPETMLLRESGTKRGGGAYVIRKGSSSSLLVQAPHTFYDQGTFPLACELFQRAHARALFINTVHRYRASPADENGNHPSDVAHAANSMFHAFTEGAVDALVKVAPPHVVQVHGFAERNLPAHAVVSAGEKRPGAPVVARVAQALEGVLGPRVLRYPEDTKELGATTNVQGIFVRRAGGVFVHVEMEEGTRRDLLRDTSLRGKALDAIGTSVMAP